MYSDQLPFARGKVFGITNSTDGAHLLGQEFIVEDIDPTDPIKKRSNRLVRIRAVRNSCSIALPPKRMVVYKAGTKHTEVDGFTRTTAQYCAGVVDEFLPSGGAAVNEVFYIVVKGPTLVTQALSTVGADVAEDDSLVAITAAASTSTTAGRFTRYDASAAATDLLANQVLNRIGRAMSTALTTSAGDVLVDIRCDY